MCARNQRDAVGDYSRYINFFSLRTHSKLEGKLVGVCDIMAAAIHLPSWRR